MGRNKIIFFFLAISTLTFGQGRNAIWCFGDSAGIDFNNMLNPVWIQSGLSPKGTCVTVCDSFGNLLFYAAADDRDGYLAGKLKTGMVYNKNHTLMQNGDSLYCESWYHEMVIVPDPSNNQQYYLFHIGVTFDYGLYYSVIDMTQDSGLGAVVSKNNQLDTMPAVDCLQAIKHGNGRDWWLFYKQWQTGNNFFYKFLITPSGVQLNSIDSVGVFGTSGGGDLVFNSDGSRFAFCNWRGLLALYNFDRCTGRITVSRTIKQEDPNGNYPYFVSCAFSPNDSLLYVASIPYFSTLNDSDIFLYQYNLFVTNIAGTKKIIQQYYYPLLPGGIRLAPDNKIYVTCDPSLYPYDSSDYYTSNTYLSVINEPNKLDTACNFQPFSFYLGGKRTYWGLPNNPNYDLGPVVSSVCDSLINAVPNFTSSIPSFNIFPNPAGNALYITQDRNELIKSISIFNSIGQLQSINYSSIKNGEYIELNISSLTPGIYFLEMMNDRQKVIKRFIKQ